MSFPFAFWKSAAAAVFDPGTLALTGWWRASFTGSPWAARASAGTSGANGTLSEATTPPATGTAVNGLTPADFDGTNDVLAMANATSTFFSAAAYSGWALVFIDAITTNSANLYANNAIVAMPSNSWFGVTLRSSGSVAAFSYDGGAGDFLGPTAAISTGAWALVQWKYDGTNLKIRVNGGAWGSQARGSLFDLTETMNVGSNIAGGGGFMDGKMLEMGLAATTISDANFDNIKSYVNSRYALAL